MLTWMANYLYERVMNFGQKYTVPKFYEILNDEFGGMNDVLYNFTGKSKHRTLAHMFDKALLFGLTCQCH
ncbi:hypothetical protein K1719_014397 [Acacia pycnantha]|nr:hypothetical protein K1719_014397 [Acacia pycnantha]